MLRKLGHLSGLRRERRRARRRVRRSARRDRGRTGARRGAAGAARRGGAAAAGGFSAAREGGGLLGRVARARGARRALAPGAFGRARRRLAEQRLHRDDAAAADAPRGAASTFAKLRSLALAQSQAADAGVASVRSAPTQNLVCTGGWSGSVKIWDAAKCECIKSVKAHSDRCTGVSWAPDSSFIATCGADGEACIWDLRADEPRARLRGHRARLGGISVHPFGRHVATTSFDHTWRLWDVETGAELLLQDHGTEVYGVAGSRRVAGVHGRPAGRRGLGRVERQTHPPFQGHSGKVLCLDWHRDGFHAASGPTTTRPGRGICGGAAGVRAAGALVTHCGRAVGAGVRRGADPRPAGQGSAVSTW